MIELLRKRRSVRLYENRPIEPEKIELLKEAVLRSPSSRNFDPWEFVFVDDAGLLKKLSKAKKHGAAFLKDALLGIVICADENKSDVWVEDCSIASILVQLAALSMGLGSCWIQIRKRNLDDVTTSEEFVRSTLKLPGNLQVLSIIAVGYPAGNPEFIPHEHLKKEKIHINGWQ